MESCGRFVNYPPSGLLINVIYSGPSHSLSGYWHVTRLLSVKLRLFRHLPYDFSLSLRLWFLCTAIPFYLIRCFVFCWLQVFFSQLIARFSSGIGVSILFPPLCPYSANMSMYSGIPLYGHPDNTVTSLLRPLFLVVHFLI